MKVFFSYLIVLLIFNSEYGVADGNTKKNIETLPYKIELREEGQTPRVIFTEKARKRSNINSIEIPKNYNPEKGLGIPSSSVIYDPQGVNWVYAEETKTSYFRVKIILKSVERSKSFITIVDEKSPISRIVDSGVTAIYGAESGVGK